MNNLEQEMSSLVAQLNDEATKLVSPNESETDQAYGRAVAKLVTSISALIENSIRPRVDAQNRCEYCRMPYKELSPNSGLIQNIEKKKKTYWLVTRTEEVKLNNYLKQSPIVGEQVILFCPRCGRFLGQSLVDTLEEKAND